MHSNTFEDHRTSDNNIKRHNFSVNHAKYNNASKKKKMKVPT